MVGATILTLILIVYLIYSRRRKIDHERHIDQLEIRVHVNGIRGKSSVTRLVAGVLREAGIRTVAKTTGSAAQVIGPLGVETPIMRRASPTIVEQMQIIHDHVDNGTQAIVMECMALRPENQQVTQDVILKANIGIITNIREDHQDVMGETLEEIADTLALTTPRNGVLISAEERAHLRERLHQHAIARGSKFIYADPSIVTDADLAGFSYMSFRENIAIGLKVAELLSIPRHTAIRGMWNSRPDVGVVDIQRIMWQGKEIIWAPLFAANDRESVVAGVNALQPFYGPDAVRIGILNNRHDRPKRALEFASVAAQDLGDFDWLITFGAYEDQIAPLLAEHGYPRDRIVSLGENVNPDLNQILDTIASLIPGQQGLVVGMVNIHTAQAELLMEFFHQQPDAPIHSHEEVANVLYRPRLEHLKDRLVTRLRGD